MNREFRVLAVASVGLFCLALLWGDDPLAPPIDSSFAALYSGEPPTGTAQGVTMDLPPSLRQENWGGGSCVHASTVSLLRWQGQYAMADWWRSQYSGGEYAGRHAKRLDAAGLRYAYTWSGDVAFLEWCVRTGRGAGIHYKTRHAINLVGLDAQYAYLLDNNATGYPERHGTYERVPRATFVQRWKERGGIAWTLVYTPPPPIPRS